MIVQDQDCLEVSGHSRRLIDGRMQNGVEILLLIRRSDTWMIVSACKEDSITPLPRTVGRETDPK